MEDTEIELSGRHDPCIVPRAVPVVESCLAFVLADHAIRSDRIPEVIAGEEAD
jgi:chorismate synthase